MIDGPCHGCEERHEACHDHCEKYAEYKKKLEEIRSARDADHKKWYRKKRNFIKAQHYYNRY